MMSVARLLLATFVLLAAGLPVSTQAAEDPTLAMLPGDPELDVFFMSEHTDDWKTCRTSPLEPDEVDFCRLVLTGE